MLISWGTVPEWVSAISAAAIVPLTWATLLKVREYTTATHRQIDVTQDQVEAAHRPILVFERSQTMMIHNIGTGPAMNVRWIETRGTDEQARADSVEPIDAFRNCGPSNDVLSNQLLQAAFANSKMGRLEVTYESISGVRYKTVREWHTTDESIPVEQRIEKI